MDHGDRGLSPQVGNAGGSITGCHSEADAIVRSLNNSRKRNQSPVVSRKEF